jgi:hypothetical protein
MNDNNKMSDNDKVIKMLCWTWFMAGLSVGLAILNVILAIKNK